MCVARLGESFLCENKTFKIDPFYFIWFLGLKFKRR